MEIIVCVKQVPGTTQVEVDPVTGVLKRDGVDGKLNPYDLYALETAFRLVEQCGGRVRTLSMGPPQAKAALLETVYMGAESGVLVSGRRFAWADVLATAYTLSQAVRMMGGAGVVLCGKQTTDGDTAQVGSEMAEFLGIPHIAGVLEVLCDGGDLVVRQGLENSILTLRAPTPCLLCTDGGINTPRLPSYKRKKSLEREPVSLVCLDDFEDRDENRYGLNGSPTQVERIFPPQVNTEKMVLRGTGEELAEALANILGERKFI